MWLSGPPAQRRSPEPSALAFVASCHSLESRFGLARISPANSFHASERLWLWSLCPASRDSQPAPGCRMQKNTWEHSAQASPMREADQHSAKSGCRVLRNSTTLPPAQRQHAPAAAGNSATRSFPLQLEMLKHRPYFQCCLLIWLGRSDLISIVHKRDYLSSARAVIRMSEITPESRPVTPR